MTPLELWHRIHNAATQAGHQPDEAVHRADQHHWPTDEPCPDHDTWLECTPFEEAATRPRGAHMTDPINIHDPIWEICRRLGLEPTNVAEITFRPLDVTATVYKTNADGAKYLETDEDGSEGDIAKDTLTFDVTT
jgi:hypothetical protein